MEENYNALTLNELRVIAKQKGIKRITSYRKNELIEVLNETNKNETVPMKPKG